MENISITAIWYIVNLIHFVDPFPKKQKELYDEIHAADFFWNKEDSLKISL